DSAPVAAAGHSLGITSSRLPRRTPWPPAFAGVTFGRWGRLGQEVTARLASEFPPPPCGGGDRGGGRFEHKHSMSPRAPPLHVTPAKAGAHGPFPNRGVAVPPTDSAARRWRWPFHGNQLSAVVGDNLIAPAFAG